MIKKQIIILGLMLLGSVGYSQTLEQKIDDYVAAISERHGIPGVALAVIKNGKVVHKKYYGKANIEHSVPIGESSIFRIYSLTKLMISTGVFQLIEQGKLTLEDPISNYVNDIPESWRGIQIKHLLTHSSGLPDMSPFTVFEGLTEEQAKAKVFGQSITFQKGDRYAYNQTAFWLLQQIIENVSGKQIEAFVREGQFTDESWGKTVLFSSDSRDIIAHRATPYFYFRTGKLIADLSFIKGRYLLSANGLNITLDELMKWDSKLRENGFLMPETKAKMWEAYTYAKDASKRFTYGWDERNVNGHVSYGFSGSLITAYRTYPNDDMSIVFLSNGLKNYYNIENSINHIAGLVDEDILDLDTLIYEKLLNEAINGQGTAFIRLYRSLKEQQRFQDIDFESALNAVGYMLLNVEKKEKALEIFKLNVTEFPKSWNVWDSLAEGYEALGDRANAIGNYRKSISLNPGNKHGLERLEALTE